MSQTECGAVRELIPDVGAGRSDEAARDAVETHVSHCSDCGEELALARMLFESRAAIPVDVSETVVRRYRRQTPTTTRPWWGISAAAVAALALGIGITSGPGPDAELDFGTELVAEVEAEDDEFWLSDDGILAGAPVFEAMSDEALAELLDELATLQGGQA